MVVKAFLFSFLISGSLFAANVVKEVKSSTKSTYRISMMEDESVSFQEKDLTIRIENLEDLRCPPNTVCFWPGSINFDLLISNAISASHISMLYQEPILINFEGYDLTITKITKVAINYDINIDLVKKTD
jgi:hypothetical protein